MKRLIFIIAVLFAPLVILPGCGTPPSERVAAVQSLKAAGHSAEGVVELSARLYAIGQITPQQARAVMDFYDTKWQPAFRLAVTAAHSDLSSYASPDLLTLLAQLSALLPQPTP